MSANWRDDPSLKSSTEPAESWRDDPSLKSPIATPEATVLEAATQKLAEGITLGAAPQLIGAGKAALWATSGDAWEKMKQGQFLGALVDRYRDSRDFETANQEKAQKDQPVVSTIANIAGQIAVPLPKLGTAASLGGRVLRAAGQSAIGGGISAGAHSDADLTKGELVPFAKDVFKGGTLGGIGGAVLGGIGGVASSATARRFSNSQAVKSSGALFSDLKKMGAVGPQAEGRIEEVGQEILRTGGWTPRGIGEKVEERILAEGPRVREFVTSATAHGATVPKTAILDTLKNEVNRLAAAPESAALSRQLESEISRLEDALPDNITPEILNARKGGYEEQVNQGLKALARGGQAIDTAANEAKSIVASVFRRHEDEALRAALPSPDYNAWLKAKQTFGNLMKAKLATDSFAAHEQGRNWIGPGILGMGGGGLAGALAFTGQPLQAGATAAATAAATAIGKKYGNAALARIPGAVEKVAGLPITGVGVAEESQLLYNIGKDKYSEHRQKKWMKEHPIVGGMLNSQLNSMNDGPEKTSIQEAIVDSNYPFNKRMDMLESALSKRPDIISKLEDMEDGPTKDDFIRSLLGGFPSKRKKPAPAAPLTNMLGEKRQDAGLTHRTLKDFYKEPSDKRHKHALTKKILEALMEKFSKE